MERFSDFAKKITAAKELMPDVQEATAFLLTNPGPSRADCVMGIAEKLPAWQEALRASAAAPLARSLLPVIFNVCESAEKVTDEGGRARAARRTCRRPRSWPRSLP